MVPSIEQEIRDLHALFGSPRDPEGRAFVPLADAYRRAGDPSRALEILADGLDRHPGLAAGHLVAGLTQRDLADDAGAEDAFRRVLELDDDNARALLGLGRMVSARGETAEGEALVARGVALDPGLGRQAAPDRVPRHSGNPEVVGAQGPAADEAEAPDSGDEAEAPDPGDDALAPLEWEVLDPSAAPTVVELAALAPDAPAGAEIGPVDRGPGPVDAPDGPLPGAEDATPPEAAVEGASAHEVLDVTALSPEPGEAPGGDDVELGHGVGADDDARSDDELAAGDEDPADDLRRGESRDFLVSADAESALFDAVEGGSSEGDAVWSGGDLDIDWDLDGGGEVPEAEVEAVEAEAVEADDEVVADGPDDDLVLDPADLAPDDWTPDESMFGALAYEDAPGTGSEPSAGIAPPGDDLLVELADLAPDIEPGRRRPDRDDDEVLPTRTLGELYARQGLLGEAVKVFEDLVARHPADADLRARLDELRTRPERAPAAAEGPVESDDGPLESNDGPPVSSFLADLLAWTPDASDGEPGSP